MIMLQGVVSLAGCLVRLVECKSGRKGMDKTRHQQSPLSILYVSRSILPDGRIWGNSSRNNITTTITRTKVAAENHLNCNSYHFSDDFLSALHAGRTRWGIMQSTSNSSANNTVLSLIFLFTIIGVDITRMLIR